MFIRHLLSRTNVEAVAAVAVGTVGIRETTCSKHREEQGSSGDGCGASGTG